MTTEVIARARTLGVGMVGAGFMARVHTHAARAAGSRLVALASSSAERADAAAGELGYDAAAADLTALLADPDIDVVHICTPNASHAAFARQALEAGKHVVCEKPLATSTDDARLLAEIAAARGLTAAVPFVYRFHPMVREARARIAAGDAGRLVSVDGAYLQDWLAAPAADDWRVDSRVGGPSRAFADIGSHLVDLLEFISGERIVRVNARTRTVHPERADHAPVDTEDLVAVLVELEGGAVGTLLVSQVAPGRKNGLVVELSGTETTVRFEQERPEQLWLGRTRRSELVDRDAELLAPDAARLSTLPPGHPMGYQDAFNAFIADAYAAIDGAQPEGLPRFDDGARAVRLTEAVLESARRGTWTEAR